MSLTSSLIQCNERSRILGCSGEQRFAVVLSRYQNFCIRYQWKSTVLGTNFGTKEKHKYMLIKKHTIFY